MIKHIRVFGLSIIVYIFMSLFLSLEISKMNVVRMNILEQNNFFSSEAITFHITSSIFPEELLKFIKEDKNIVIHQKLIKVGANYGSALYRGSLTKEIPNIIKGRYFTEEDLNSTIPVIIIGKDMTKSIIREDNTDYFIIDDIKYRVIGIMGGKDSSLNNNFIVNLSSYLVNNCENISYKNFYEVQWDVNKDNKDKFYNLENKLKEKYSDTKFSIDNSFSTRNPAIKYIMNRIKYILSVCIIFILNIFSITTYYINRRKKEIGVLKAYGIQNKHIIKKILLQYQLVSIICSIIALSLHHLIYIFFYSDSLFYKVHYFNIIGLIILSMIIGLVTSIFPLFKLYKISPNEIMKGCHGC